MRVTPFLFPLAVSFLFACTSTVTGTGSSSSGGSGSPSSSEGTATGGGTNTKTPSGETPSDTSEYEALFGPPESTSLTENSIGGLWAGQTSSNDLRLKFTASSITIAMKCRTSTIGTKIAAQVSGTAIRIVESQQIGAEYDSCSIKVRPLSIPKCESSTTYDCFIVDGSTLYFQGATLFTAGGYSPSSGFTKLSD